MLDCGKLKMYTINSKSTPEATIQNVTASNPSKSSVSCHPQRCPCPNPKTHEYIILSVKEKLRLQMELRLLAICL